MSIFSGLAKMLSGRDLDENKEEILESECE